MTFEQYFPKPRLRNRVLNALWKEMRTKKGPRPATWLPDPAKVESLDLIRIWGIGDDGAAAINLWLTENGYKRNRIEERRAPRLTLSAFASEIERLQSRVAALEATVSGKAPPAQAAKEE